MGDGNGKTVKLEYISFIAVTEWEAIQWTPPPPKMHFVPTSLYNLITLKNEYPHVKLFDGNNRVSCVVVICILLLMELMIQFQDCSFASTTASLLPAIATLPRTA